VPSSHEPSIYILLMIHNFLEPSIYICRNVVVPLTLREVKYVLLINKKLCMELSIAQSCSHSSQGCTDLGLQILNPFSCEPMWVNGFVCGSTFLSSSLHKCYFLLRNDHFVLYNPCSKLIIIIVLEKEISLRIKENVVLPTGFLYCMGQLNLVPLKCGLVQVSPFNWTGLTVCLQCYINLVQEFIFICGV